MAVAEVEEAEEEAEEEVKVVVEADRVGSGAAAVASKAVSSETRSGLELSYRWRFIEATVTIIIVGARRISAQCMVHDTGTVWYGILLHVVTSVESRIK